jgi:hypothetical protein
VPPTARPLIAISVFRQVELNISARPLTVPVGETLSVIGVAPHSRWICVPAPMPLVTLSLMVTTRPSALVVAMPT